jgi:chromosome segregation ATPase
MAAGAHPAGWIKRHERHLDFLDASIREVQQGLETAWQQVSDARSELELALAEWRQVQSKCDALQSMREAWQASQRSSLERREEQAVEGAVGTWCSVR